MKKILIFYIGFTCYITSLFAQTESIIDSFWKPTPRNYDVKHALEVESLVPMFFTGGYHFAVGYRYEKFRIRASIINGGTYDAEEAGIKNSSPEFKRYYTTSPGVFFGYNVWKNLELYTYLEFHTFEITQTSTGNKQDLKSVDTGLGFSYQFFIGRVFYIQPGVHLYLRKDNHADFNGAIYNIPNMDFSPVVRIGARFWRKYQ
jgi:hypothetical protein